MKNHTVLTISLLISNRPATVRKCLDSIKPILEQVPSELILVDTGCGEQVRKIIEEYTDQIIEFEWCKDFAKARNAGLEKARGEWFLFLDDDEWFEDVTEIIAFFNSGEYKEYGMAAYIQRNYLEKDGSVYTDLLVGRMTKLYPDTRFIYRIHEYFNQVHGITKKFNAYVHHYGYIYDSVQEARAHSMRNISLLLEEHAEDPGNLKHTLQLAQEYNVISEYNKSLDMSLEAIALSEQGKTNNNYFLSSLYGNEIGCYMDLYRYEEAIQKGELYLTHEKTDKMVRDLIAGYLATAYMERKDYGKVLEYARYYWNGYQDYLKNEVTFLGFVTNITGKCFEEHNRSVVLGHGIRAAAMLGQGEQAWEWFDSFDWKAPQMFASEEMIRAVVERMPEAQAQERGLYVKMCNVLIGRQELEGCVLRTVSDCCRRGENLEERIQTLAAYEGIESGHWFFKLREIVIAADRCRKGTACSREEKEGREPEAGNQPGREPAIQPEVGHADQPGREPGIQPASGTAELSGAEAERLAAEVWENPNLSMSSIRKFAMLDALEALGGSNRKVLETLPFYRWEKGIRAYFEQFSWEDADWWNGQLKAVLSSEEEHMLVWRGMYGMACAVRVALQMEKDKASEAALEGQKPAVGSRLSESQAATGSGEEENGGAEQNFGKLKEGLQEYAVCNMALCEKMYRPEIIAQSRDMFPEEYQGAYLAADLLERIEKKDYSQAVERIKEIRKLLPGLDNVMKPYLKWIDVQLKQQKQESNQAAGEFQVLARQIKQRLRTLMNAGQDQAALAVARQLQSLLPEDEEIRQIIERLG